MNGLRQAAAYAMKPNELGRCGPGRGVSFSEEAEKKIARGFLEETKPGDLVSFHLDFGIEIIAKKQGENLDHYTREVLAALK